MPEAAQDPRIDELLAGLNPPQRDAVVHGEGPLLILAGAGSGKTRVLTHRIAYLMRTKQARADEILAITFTNKAAQEMRERVELLVGRATRAMWVMTFHSACARMLRADAHRLGYTRQFTIYDAADQRRLIKRCLDDLDIDAKRFTPRAMQAQISDAKNKLRSSEDYRQLVGSYFEQTVADVYEQYERELHRMNAMDFDDLLVRSVNLLELFQEVRDRYSAGLPLDPRRRVPGHQPRPVPLAPAAGVRAPQPRGSRRRRPERSMRSAARTSKNILNFQDDFVDAHVVKLEQNYRSTQTILSAANAVVANNRGRMEKALWTEIGEGDPIKVRELSDEHAEARYVAAEIERMVDEGVSREEIAVFYRTNAQSRVLEDMLVRAQIGYQVIGGTKFYERAEIRDAVAYLTFLANPQDARGVHARRQLAEARARADLAQPRAQPRRHDGRAVWDAAEHADESVPGLGKAAQKALGRFMSTMVRLRERMESRLPSATCSTSCCARPATTTRSRPSGRSRRRAGSRTSRSSCASGASTTRWPSRARVGEFLQQIALIADVDSLRDDEGLVTLMTLHNAKGLEFPIVFMIGMEDGVFPHSRAIDEGEIEEERRLAYVGLTRAMRDLTLTFARRRNSFGAQSFGMRSRFIDEIPRELTDLEDKAAVGAGWSPGRVASWSNAAAATAEAHPDTGGTVFRLGDDVVHAAFGEGVVTGTEPGGIVVVRFAGDGSGAQADGRLRPDQETLTFL